MWDALGLPSIFAIVVSQQTLPVEGVSRISVLPRFDAGAPSLAPRRLASSLVVALVAAPAAIATASDAAATPRR